MFVKRGYLCMVLCYSGLRKVSVVVVITGVHIIKRPNVRENEWAFGREGKNCSLTSRCLFQLSVKQSCSVMWIFLCLFTAVIVNRLHNYFVAGPSTGLSKSLFLLLKRPLLKTRLVTIKTGKIVKVSSLFCLFFRVSLRWAVLSATAW